MKWHISYDFMCCSRFTHYRMYKSTIYRFQSYLELPGKTQCQHFSSQKFMLLFCAQEVLISMAPLGVVPGKCGSDLGLPTGRDMPFGTTSNGSAFLAILSKGSLQAWVFGIQFWDKAMVGTGWQVLLAGGRAGLRILGMLVSPTEWWDTMWHPATWPLKSVWPYTACCSHSFQLQECRV